MNSQHLQIALSARDPVVARDGRPFSFGQRMRGLSWLYPSVFAGALRTLIGECAGGFEAGGAQLVQDLLELSVAGPLPMIESKRGRELCFPAPLDVVVQPGKTKAIETWALRPVDLTGTGMGCDSLDSFGLSPCLAPETAQATKPMPVPAWWSASRMAEWLSDPAGSRPLANEAGWPAGYFHPHAQDRRVHVAIAGATGVAEDGQLFVTTGLTLDRLMVANEFGRYEACAVTGRVSGPAGGRLAPTVEQLNSWAAIGGERRLAHWRTEALSPEVWGAPSRVRQVLADRSGPVRVRMQLATPALFGNGWLPAWLKGADIGGGRIALVGAPPSTGSDRTDVMLRLCGACVGRWQPISGWSHERRGPKAVRRLVPAGSVYFFDVVSGDATSLAEQWLSPVSDLQQDRADGFGLALWGAWQAPK